MKTKYIFVSGGVISGIGKGVTVSSIGLLLKSCGYRVSPIKFEGYLNIDAGTINPIEHGDVFLCEDGTEADMDIGSYEKFLDEDMGKANFVTMGQVYQNIIDRERRFEYQGEDVEAVHITEEIINRINHLTAQKGAEIIIIELGGTAGEYWNVFFYEAARVMNFKHPGDVIHIHVSYVPTPAHLGEPKTKPVQLSVRTLNSLGIQPDIIVARSEQSLDKRRRDRLALFCNVSEKDIINSPNLKSVYEVPLRFAAQNLHQRIFTKLNLKPSEPGLDRWNDLMTRIYKSGRNEIRLAIAGKYFGTGDYQLRDSYAALFDALNHASWAIGANLNTLWIDAEEIEREGADKILNRRFNGIIVPIGWGKRGAEGMIAAASYARRKKIPYLGLCYGMQLAVVAFARDVLGWNDADTQENSKKTSHPVIHLMPSQKKFMKSRAYGGTMRLGGWEAIVRRDTLAWKIYQQYHAFKNHQPGLTSERHRHRYEFNDQFRRSFEKSGMTISARSKKENLAEIVELPESEHPFYLGTQGHPEYKSRPLNPHPVFLGFIKACLENNRNP